jgi:mono/diheme cytochrome c family protein
MTVLRFSAVLILSAFIFTGCDDQGDPVTPPSTGTTEVKFSTDIQPMLTSKGCVGCHGSNGGLSVASVASLLAGGNHGPAVVAGKADSSNIVLKLRGTAPFGARMPQGGPYLSTAEIKKFEDWINAGAKNN